jgi:hypothetical protein
MKLKSQGANQTELELSNGAVVLFSYETPVACVLKGVGYRTAQSWSRTTSRHIGMFFARHGVVGGEVREQAFFYNLTEVKP